MDKNTSESEHPVLLCNYVDVYKYSKITSDIDFMQASARLEEIRKFHVRVGDVLVTKDSERPDDIAIAAFVAENITNLLCGYHLALIRPDSNILNGCFLNYLFSSKLFRFQYERMANGVTRFGLSQNAFKDSIIPLPSLEEQNKIVSFLDQQTAKLDQLVEKKQLLIDLLQEKRQALITRAVTKGLNPNVPMKDSGIEWLGEVPAHWKIMKLTHIFRGIGSGTTPDSNEIAYYDGDIPWVITGDLNDGELHETSKHITKTALSNYSSLKLYPPGTLLIAMYGASIGKLAILQTSAATNQACCALYSPKDVDTKFVFYWLMANRKHIVSLALGGGQPNISQDIIRNLRICFPPIDEQNAILKHIDDKTKKSIK